MKNKLNIRAVHDSLVDFNHFNKDELNASSSVVMFIVIVFDGPVINFMNINFCMIMSEN